VGEGRASPDLMVRLQVRHNDLENDSSALVRTDAAVTLGIAVPLSSFYAVCLLERGATTHAALMPLAFCALAMLLWLPILIAPHHVKKLAYPCNLLGLAAPSIALAIGPPVALALLGDGPDYSRHAAYCCLLLCAYSAAPAVCFHTPNIILGAVMFIQFATCSNGLLAMDVVMLGTAAVAVPVQRLLSCEGQSIQQRRFTAKKPMTMDLAELAAEESTSSKSKKMMKASPDGSAHEAVVALHDASVQHVRKRMTVADVAPDQPIVQKRSDSVFSAVSDDHSHHSHLVVSTIDVVTPMVTAIKQLRMLIDRHGPHLDEELANELAEVLTHVELAAITDKELPAIDWGREMKELGIDPSVRDWLRSQLQEYSYKTRQRHNSNSSMGAGDISTSSRISCRLKSLSPREWFSSEASASSLRKLRRGCSSSRTVVRQLFGGRHSCATMESGSQLIAVQRHAPALECASSAATEESSAGTGVSLPSAVDMRASAGAASSSGVSRRSLVTFEQMNELSDHAGASISEPHTEAELTPETTEEGSAQSKRRPRVLSLDEPFNPPTSRYTSPLDGEMSVIRSLRARSLCKSNSARSSVSFMNSGRIRTLSALNSRRSERSLLSACVSFAECPVRTSICARTLRPKSERLEANRLRLRVLELDDAMQHNAELWELTDSLMTEWSPKQDVCRVDEITGGHSLYVMGMLIFRHHGLLDKRVDNDTMRRFLLRMEQQYGNNTYHCSTHAADVLTMTHLFLTNAGFKERLSDIQILASLLGAIIHDFNHPGTSNAHEVKIRSERAILHSDQSVLERHHLASAFKVLHEPGHQVLEKLSLDEYGECRSLVIEAVLHTDLSKHFDVVGRLKALAARQGYKAAKEAKTHSIWNSPFLSASVDAKLLCISIIKFADLGHVCKRFGLHKRWVERITAEFYVMGDTEKLLGVSVSPMCDRAVDTDVVKSQIGFLQFVCIPFFKVMADLVDPRLEPYRNCQENFWQWHKLRNRQDAATQLLLRKATSPDQLQADGTCAKRGSGIVQALVEIPPDPTADSCLRSACATCVAQ